MIKIKKRRVKVISLKRKVNDLLKEIEILKSYNNEENVYLLDKYLEEYEKCEECEEYEESEKSVKDILKNRYKDGKEYDDIKYEKLERELEEDSNIEMFKDKLSSIDNNILHIDNKILLLESKINILLFVFVSLLLIILILCLI